MRSYSPLLSLILTREGPVSFKHQSCIHGPVSSSNFHHRLSYGCHSWYQVLFGDAFKFSVCAPKLAKSLMSQSGNFISFWVYVERERAAALYRSQDRVMHLDSCSPWHGWGWLIEKLPCSHHSHQITRAKFSMPRAIHKVKLREDCLSI